MDNTERQQIIRNTKNLIRFTRYSELMDLCLQERILFPVMQEEIEKCPDHVQRHTLLFEKITKRGPKAYNILLNICRQHFPDAAALLLEPVSSMGYSEISIRGARNLELSAQWHSNQNIDNNIIASQVDGSNASELPTPKTKILKLSKLEANPELNLVVKKSTKFHKNPKYDDDKYNYSMKSRHRGVLVLVNIIKFEGRKDRSGALVDRDYLITLFRGMEFDIIYEENITADTLNVLIKELKDSEYLRRSDCLVVALLSHGNIEAVELAKNSYANIKEIIEHFNNENCSIFAGKPKIFILPFCRGKSPDAGVKARRIAETDGISNNSFVNIATLSDVKICYATVPGYETFRDNITGSWYVEVMSKVWAEDAHDTCVNNLLMKVGKEVSNRRESRTFELQTECNESHGFHKTLYFNPGYYGE